MTTEITTSQIRTLRVEALGGAQERDSMAIIRHPPPARTRREIKDAAQAWRPAGYDDHQVRLRHYYEGKIEAHLRMSVKERFPLQIRTLRVEALGGAQERDSMAIIITASDHETNGEAAAFVTYCLNVSDALPDGYEIDASETDDASETTSGDIDEALWADYCAETPTHLAAVAVLALVLRDRAIAGLRAEAGAAGDADMVATCDRAIDGDHQARVLVAESLIAARSQADESDERIEGGRALARAHLAAAKALR